jgi:hypothetical protein
MLMALSTFFRTSLSMDPSADVSLSEEIALQRLYLDIEKVRFPIGWKSNDIPEDLPEARARADPPAAGRECDQIWRLVDDARVELSIRARRLDGGPDAA